MFKRESGKTHIEYFRKKASTVFAKGDLVYADGSGAIQPADATSGDHIGVIKKAVTATDDDYASNTMVPVEVPNDNSVTWRVDVGTGTFTSAMVGNRYDLKDANEIDVSATSKKVVTIKEYVSSSIAIVSINAMVGNADVATT